MSKITITITIPADRFGCARCDAEKIARFKDLVHKHVKQQVKDLLESINETDDKKGLGSV